MTKHTPLNDPHAKREAQKYDRPIASREYILRKLKRSGPMHREQLAEALDISEEEPLEALRRRLRAMVRDGQLMQTRKAAYGLVDKMDLIRGQIQAHRDGFGFVIPTDDGQADLFLNAREMSAVFHNDEVLCRISGYDRRGRPEGVIVEVLNRAIKTLVGRLCSNEGVAFVKPHEPRITHDIFIADKMTLGATIGHYVIVEITSPPRWRQPATGKIVEILGDTMAPGLEIDVAIRCHQIPFQWPEAATDEAHLLPSEPVEADKEGREDLRELPFVTIDGEDARDFDDAVYCQAKKRGGWELWVAIADVSHYVTPESALDQEAYHRANSVYFPGRVIPMLPEVLSNSLCSLKPRVDRLCMVCKMTVSQKGKLTNYEFFEAVIHSHARLTYTAVASMLDTQQAKSKTLRKKHADILPHVIDLHQLYQALRSSREQRGAMDFDTVETRIVFNKKGKIDEIVPVMRNDAHKLIEECMLCANVATARFLHKHKIPILYRVHAGPKPEKLATLRLYLGELGLTLLGGDEPSPKDYAQLLSTLVGRPDASIIQIMVLRSLSQAVYQPKNGGHFGLHYPMYTHFTSPIRRYADLLVHRAIRYLLRRAAQNKTKLGTLPCALYPYDQEVMLSLGQQTSRNERRADEATRDAIAWLKCDYLKDHVGETFPGVIVAVMHFGFFVELADLYIDGLVHISALKGDYYHFDPAKQRLLGEHTRTAFQLGDKVKVQVVRVDLDDKQIDLELQQQTVGRKKRAPASVDKKQKAGSRKKTSPRKR